MARKFREMGNSRDIYCYANWGVVNFERAYQTLPPGTKIPVMPQFSYMPDQFLGKNEKESKFEIWKVYHLMFNNHYNNFQAYTFQVWSDKKQALLIQGNLLGILTEVACKR